MKFLNLIFGTNTAGVTVIDFMPIQTQGAEADARRADLTRKAQACIERMGRKYRLHGEVEKGSHEYVLPPLQNAAKSVVRIHAKRSANHGR